MSDNLKEIDKIAHIVYASDDLFSEILGVSLVSLYENSEDMQDIVVYILESDISEENKKKLSSIAEKYSRHPLVWIEAKDIAKELKMDIQVDRGSLSQYARLFVSRDLPENLDRVLYLDCDIIFNKSICNLWNMDMNGQIIAALKDAFSKQYRANIGLKPTDVMFNSGVMLIDLNKWREKQIEQKLLTFISEKKGKVQQGDQGALNAVLSYDTYCFHPKYNSVTIFYDFSYKELLKYRKPPEFYTEDDINEAVENPTIIHFTTSFLSKRPWYKGCEHHYCDKWLAYKKLSPWADSDLWEYKDNSKLKKMYLAVISLLPRKAVISLSGLLQAYGRPLINKLK